jgi:hypothetical protein
MFRGGKVVDSRGTGITSGLMDRPGLQSGGTPTGAEVKAMAEKNIFGVPFLRDLTRSTNFIDDLAYNYLLRPAANVANLGTNYVLGTNIPMIEKRDSNKFYDDLVQKEATRLSNELIPQVTDEDEYEEDYSDITEKEQTKKRQEKEEKEIKTTDPNDPTGSGEQTTELDARTLMKENAELFKELLGEANEKKLKDARIGDVSDYLLKFFEGSQKEGATVGSSAADVAAFATAKDSRTEKAKQAIDKQDQTAIALAINDYIAGKRSKEQIDALTAKSDLALSNKLAVIQLAKEDLAANIIEAGKGGALGSQKLIQGIKSTPSLKGKGIEQFSSEKGESVEYESGYENKVFIDTDTETIFTFDPTGNKISLY